MWPQENWTLNMCLAAKANLFGYLGNNAKLKSNKCTSELFLLFVFVCFSKLLRLIPLPSPFRILDSGNEKAFYYVTSIPVQSSQRVDRDNSAVQLTQNCIQGRPENKLTHEPPSFRCLLLFSLTCDCENLWKIFKKPEVFIRLNITFGMNEEYWKSSRV